MRGKDGEEHKREERKKGEAQSKFLASRIQKQDWFRKILRLKFTVIKLFKYLRIIK